ncbi:endolytic transglycosylase MltG [Streptomonospora litoralis]|uniref:Endolytic murein transglycosylase n=1 Tax=Streptomonospora litoralis TaxID=2498135 RepID=A0A4P6Q872_9ACTN|nr:endolytic transglycosylase MltG [Streptomonospora litoralis]QBI55097.1 putative aminodeoxychorismate lyase [Streptomonospora litoralis]
MSDRSPYDDGDRYRSRRGRRRVGDPHGDARRGPSDSGRQPSESHPEPFTDPWRSPPDRPGAEADHPTGSRPPAPEPPGDPGYPDQPPPRWEDAQAARPRGRRHRGGGEGADPGPATGPQPYAPADGAPSRGRRRRPRYDDEAEEHLAWSRPAPDDRDDGFQTAPRRTLDFDSVPVRRKRPRGEDSADEPRGGRRRRSADSGAFPAVPDAAPDDGRTGRRRRSADSGAFPAVEEPDPARSEDRSRAQDSRGGRRRRRGADTGEFEFPAESGGDEGRYREEEREAPRRGRRSAPQAPDDPDGRRDHGDRTGFTDPAYGDEDDAPEDDGGRRGGRRRARRSAERSGSSRSRGGKAGSARRERGRGPRKALIAALAVALVALLATGGYVGRGYLFPPDYEGRGSGDVQVTVEEGATGSAVARNLADKGVVASSRAFLNALDDHGGSLAPGTYRLQERMSGEAAVAMLMDPASRVQAHITFKEGLRSEEILNLISEETGIPMEELRAAVAEGERLGLPDYAEQGAEGYLFPDTYDMPADAGAAALLKRMVDRFHEVAEEVSLVKSAEERNLTPNEAMSVAAIVQAEAGSAEDMPKIARVVYNRLQRGMELGMDSTCFYVLDEYGIALNGEQLQECKDSGSEYATYGRQGLPVGPIVSPGRDAIEAALNPADGDWLYFVATDPENGVTEFAETHAEFLQLKQEFQQNRGDA